MFRLEDQSTGVKCLAWSEAYGKLAGVLKNDQLIIVEGRIESAEGADITFIVNDAWALEDALPKNAKSVTITLPDRELEEDYLQDLMALLNSSDGRCEVFFELPIDGIEAKLYSQQLSIRGTGALESDLKARGCGVNWIL